MQKSSLEELAIRYGISAIYLFGSQADTGKKYVDSEEVTPDRFSDLDVAVAFEIPPQEVIKTYGELYKDISILFDPFNIDLVFMHEVNTLFQFEIIKGVRIYEKNTTQADEFEENIMKRAEDLSFKKRVFDKEVMEAIKDGYFEFEYSPPQQESSEKEKSYQKSFLMCSLRWQGTGIAWYIFTEKLPQKNFIK